MNKALKMLLILFGLANICTSTSLSLVCHSVPTEIELSDELLEKPELTVFHISGSLFTLQRMEEGRFNIIGIYDNVNLCIIVISNEKNTINLSMNTRNRDDAKITNDDYIECILQSGNDEYKVIVNPKGNVYDEKNKDITWDTKIKSKFNLEEGMWRVAILFPLIKGGMIKVSRGGVNIKEKYEFHPLKFEPIPLRVREMRTEEYLRVIRVAVHIFFSKYDGLYPERIDTPPFIGDTPENFMKELPCEEITGSNKVLTIEKIQPGKKEEDYIDGTGGWLYFPQTGEVYLNLKGKDSRGKEYSKY
jgi:hypothetical protein